MRIGKSSRKTLETNVEAKINIDGKGESNIDTGIGFLDHMLTIFSKHSLMDIDLSSKGDLDVDFHHSVEDVGIVLGSAFNKALDDKKGIKRYGDTHTPMDESLALVVIDISNRSNLIFNAEFTKDKVGDFDTELVKEFFKAFSYNSFVTLHINLLQGGNAHHEIESIFKGFARSIKVASSISSEINGVMSSKDVL